MMSSISKKFECVLYMFRDWCLSCYCSVVVANVVVVAFDFLLRSQAGRFITVVILISVPWRAIACVAILKWIFQFHLVWCGCFVCVSLLLFFLLLSRLIQYAIKMVKCKPIVPIREIKKKKQISHNSLTHTNTRAHSHSKAFRVHGVRALACPSLKCRGDNSYKKRKSIW